MAVQREVAVPDIGEFEALHDYGYFELLRCLSPAA